MAAWTQWRAIKQNQSEKKNQIIRRRLNGTNLRDTYTQP